jgi:hypothetical protein
LPLLIRAAPAVKQSSTAAARCRWQRTTHTCPKRVRILRCSCHKHSLVLCPVVHQLLRVGDAHAVRVFCIGGEGLHGGADVQPDDAVRRLLESVGRLLFVVEHSVRQAAAVVCHAQRRQQADGVEGGNDEEAGRCVSGGDSSNTGILRKQIASATASSPARTVSCPCRSAPTSAANPPSKLDSAPLQWRYPLPP